MTLITSTDISSLPDAQTRYDDFRELIQGKKVILCFIIFSVVLHTLFLFRFNTHDFDHKLDSPISHNIEITLSNYLPEKITPQKTMPPVTHKAITTPVEKEIAEPATPEPVKHAPIEATIPEKAIIEHQPVHNTPKNLPADPALLTNAREQYLDTISAHLEKHKFYPRSARRRHIEGNVKVSFELLKNGNIINLKLFSGHTVLQKAAEESINSALPLPTRPENLLAMNTISIEYSMQFSLKE